MQLTHDFEYQGKTESEKVFPFMFTNQSVNLLFYFLKSLFELLLFVLKQFIGSLLLFDTSLVPHTLHISPMRNCRRV